MTTVYLDLMKDAVEFGDKTYSAFAFQKLIGFMEVMRQISILDCGHTIQVHKHQA